MKGLISIPGEKELEEAYFRLQSQKDLTASDIEPCELALWSQWSRFDPRLAEQLVEYFIRNWMRISPLDLRESLNAQPWPSAAGVLLEQSLKFIDRPVKRFRHWFNLVMEGIPSADGEQYFIGLRAFAGKEMLRDAIYSIQPYKKWGYFGRDVLINKARRHDRTLVSASTRRRVLDELVAKRQRFTAKEYREALENKVSTRQAELDLSSHPRLSPVGRTRQRVYRVK